MHILKVFDILIDMRDVLKYIFDFLTMYIKVLKFCNANRQRDWLEAKGIQLRPRLGEFIHLKIQ